MGQAGAEVNVQDTRSAKLAAEMRHTLESELASASSRLKEVHLQLSHTTADQQVNAVGGAAAAAAADQTGWWQQQINTLFDRNCPLIVKACAPLVYEPICGQ